MAAANGLPRPHILHALDLDERTLPPHIADCLDGKRKGTGPPPIRPAPARSRGGRDGTRLRSMTATKARRLLSLGYAPRTVSRLLGLKPRDVEAFARTRTGRFPAPLSPWYPTARDEAWRHDRDTGPCGEPLEPPPPSNAVEPIEPGGRIPRPAALDLRGRLNQTHARTEEA